METPSTPSRLRNGTVISPSSAISLGLVITIIAATWVIASTINHATSTIEAKTNEWKALETRVEVMEKSRETWTDADMFKWAVHLQKENPSLKVPEPEYRNR